MKLSNKQINEIAQSLDVDLECYIHKETAEVHSLPNRDSLYFEDSEGLWDEAFQAIDQKPDDYIKIEKPDSHESFQFMERFVEKLPSSSIQNRLITALNKSKPFRNFRHIVHNHEATRQAWFKHKMEQYEAYVRRELRLELEEESEELSVEDIDLDGKQFVLVQNSANGVVDDETVFYYKQVGNLVTADYFGGTIKYGKIIAKREGDQLEMYYQCLTTDGELKAGKALARIIMSEDERIALRLYWQWLDDPKQQGHSEYIEVV